MKKRLPILRLSNIDMKEVLLKRPDPNNPQVKSYVEAIERGMRDYHAFPKDNGSSWIVKRLRESAERTFATKEQAIAAAKQSAKEDGSDAFIHDDKFNIESSYSFRT